MYLSTRALPIPIEWSANRKRSRNWFGGDYSREVLVLYLKRPQAKSGELRRCGGALQIQH